MTEVAEREQRLNVLNRVLRHNVRTDANIIQGYLELAGKSDPAGTVVTLGFDRAASRNRVVDEP